MSRPLSGHTLFYMQIYLYMFTRLRVRHGLFILCYFMVILRSTTGPYGRSMIEVAYGEILFSLYRACVGDDSSRRVVGVLTYCRPCQTYPGNTSIGSMYIIFLIFLTIKIYMYYVFKSIHVYDVIQKHWWSLTLSWPDEVQRTFSTAHLFKKKIHAVFVVV